MGQPIGLRDPDGLVTRRRTWMSLLPCDTML